MAKFGPKIWEKDLQCYSNPPMLFIGPKSCYTHSYGRLPSLLHLFEKLWSSKLQRRIARKTNWYASKVIDEESTTRDGLHWTPFGLQEFEHILLYAYLWA